MEPLVVLVLVLALLVLANILLLTAVLRRLTAHERRLTELGHLPAVETLAIGLPPGSALPAFSWHTTNGLHVTTGDFVDGHGVLAFFSADCAACEVHAPEFAEVSRGLTGAGVGVLAIVCGRGADADRLVDDLDGTSVARVDDEDDPVITSFELGGFPVYVAVRDVRVVACVMSSAELLEILGQLPSQHGAVER